MHRIHERAAGQEMVAKQAEPSPTTVGDLLDQKLAHLAEEFMRVFVLKRNLRFSVRIMPAADIRELAQLL